MDTKRLYYIDWLRVLVILSLIPFHASLTYLRYGTVYIKEPVSGLAALPFLIIEVPLGDFFMTLLFFVSGIASFYSFKSRGSGRYIGERLQKLMLPFLLGYLFLCPVTAYLQALYEGFAGGFLSFIPQFFWYKIFHYHGYGHLWFLFYLFVFSMICAPLFSRWQRDQSRIERIGGFISKGHRLLLPAGAIVLFELCLRPFFHGDQTLIFDWANDAVYLSLFLFGYVFAADERIQEKIKEYFKTSIVFGTLSLATLYYVNIQSQMFYSNEVYLTPLWVLSKGVYECSAIIFLINVGRSSLNKGGRVIEYLSRASFTIYIFHFLPVTFFTLLFIDFKMHIFAKYLMVVVFSYITVFVIYELWRRASAIRRSRGRRVL
ncbi:MAG TPA: acyltransferase family protein [Anaerovoracaceae bacterium]|nr:acyltransferase family protein [Anaerovoracaceae bacterium]